MRLSDGDWLTGPAGGRFFLVELEPQVDCWRYTCTATGYSADGAATETLQMTGAEPRWEP